MNEIQDIVDAIVVLQNAVPTPTDEKDITHAYDEQPESGATFPCFINIVREVGEFKRQSAARQHAALAIDMYLCFEQGSGIYADRSRRLWYQAVMDYFDQHQGIGNTVHMAAIERAAFDEPLQVTETLRYPGIKFELKALMKASAVTLAMDGPPAYAPACELSSAITTTTTTTVNVTAVGSNPIAVWDVIQIDNERMVVIASTTILPPDTHRLTAGRGYGGTTAATHLIAAPILKWGSI